jgi:hypothetical protein
MGDADLAALQANAVPSLALKILISARTYGTDDIVS